MIHLDKWLNGLGKGGIFAIGILLIGLIGWLDYITGFEITFSFFYLISITLVTWYVGLRAGVGMTFVGVLFWLISNWIAGETYSNEWIRLFNAGVRLTVFSLIAYLLHELKTIYRKEHVLARTDFLTGAFNRREFAQQLELEIERARRLGYPISLAYIDLDNFKVINDNEGHRAGDAQLRLIAHTILHTIRKTDVFARLGGDEFGLILPNVNQADAKYVLEKIENAVMQELHRVHSPVTLSTGVVTFKLPSADADVLLQRADALMYEAKLAGKNRVVYKEIT